MKKVFVLFLISVCMLSLVACGGKSDSDTYTLTMAALSNEEDSVTKGYFEFKRIVEERSGGRIKVDVLHSGQLGGSRDYLESLQMNSVQAAESTTSTLTSYLPEFLVFDLPYIAESSAHAREVLDGGLGQLLGDKLEATAGIKVIGWIIRSPRIIYNSRNPINTVEDMSGMKVRVMESPLMTRTFELLGAIPVPLSATERYIALQTGVVHAAENSVGIILAQKEYEVTKYVSITEHFVSPNLICMSAAFYNSLPADLQKIVSDAGVEAALFASAIDAENMQSDLDQLVEYGMEINNVDNKTPFMQKVQPLYKEYEAQIGADIIAAFSK